VVVVTELASRGANDGNIVVNKVDFGTVVVIVVVAVAVVVKVKSSVVVSGGGASVLSISVTNIAPNGFRVTISGTSVFLMIKNGVTVITSVSVAVVVDIVVVVVAAVVVVVVVDKIPIILLLKVAPLSKTGYGLVEEEISFWATSCDEERCWTFDNG